MAKMRIVDALIEVLKETSGLTHREAYREIVKRNLYSFGAKDPEGVVNGNLRRHCEDLDFPSACSSPENACALLIQAFPVI